MADDNSITLDSPFVLAGSNVITGIGQMLVLVVGRNRYIGRKDIQFVEREEE